MKIAVTGTHRVGKTTLAEKLQENLLGFEYRMEPYHELEAYGYEFSETPNVDDYLIQLEHSINQIRKSDHPVIFDRCPIDLLAYVHALDETKSIQLLFTKIAGILTSIDLLVFVPIEEPDLIGCRDPDLPNLRRKVNEVLNDWVWDFATETIMVTGTVGERLDQVLSRISPELKIKNAV